MELKSIVAFGDSITRGHTLPPEEVWVGRLPSILRKKRGIDISVLNAGGNGNTSAEGLKRIETDVLSHMPGLVLVEFGGNDATKDPARAVSLDAFERNLTTICDKVKAKGGRLVFMTFPPVIDKWHAWGNDAYYKKWRGLDACVEEYRQCTRKLAKRLGCPLFELDKFLRRQMETLGAERLIEKDGVHLTGEANLIVADAIAEFISRDFIKS